MTDLTAEEGPDFANDVCVRFLEKCLTLAKKGKVQHVAIAMAEVDRIIAESVGGIDCQTEINQAIDLLKQRINKQVMERIAPTDPNTPANEVCFNLAQGIMSYDFLMWLIGAEMARRRAGVDEKLKIAFYRGNARNVLPDYHAQMLKNVIGPMLSLVEASSHNKFGGRSDFSTGYNEIVAAHKAGEEVPKLNPSFLASGVVKSMLDNVPQPVTITLREAATYPHRNSNVEAWLRFAKFLEAKGEEVIVIRDTAKAEEDIPDHSIFPLASTDLHIRVALYQQAKFNCFVGNGPATLNFHLDTPFFMLAEPDPKHLKAYEPCWPEWWPIRMGINMGEQFPWFTADQRIIWKADTYDNLVEAWETRA